MLCAVLVIACDANHLLSQRQPQAFANAITGLDDVARLAESGTNHGPERTASVVGSNLFAGTTVMRLFSCDTR
jgi:hypothetical protein